MIIKIPAGFNGFMEDKDLAKKIRKEQIIPSLEKGMSVVLDFSDVHFATQSFVHALIGESLKRFGDKALELLEFHHCSPVLKSVIEIVVDYSFADFDKISALHSTSNFPTAIA